MSLRSSARAPRQGCLLHSPGVEARSADDPGLPEILPIGPTPQGVAPSGHPLLRATPGGVEGVFRSSYPGVVGANAPPTPGL